MIIHPRGAWALFLACLVILSATFESFAADRDVLLDLVPLLALPLSGWSSSNTSSVCAWERINCDNDGRVKDLDLSSANDAAISLLRGSIPQSIAQLERLQVISLENNFIYGDLPPALFTLPNIREIYLSNTGLTVNFPANISSSITRLKVSQTKVVSRIPHANWSAMRIFTMEATGVSCPLPSSLVAHFSTGGVLTECSFASNNLVLGADNLVCGQISSSAITCALSPLGHISPYFASDDQRQVTKFSGQLGNFTLEFNQNETFIFSTYYTRTGAPRQYRREYISFRLMPISDTYGNDFEPKSRTFGMPVWDTFTVERNRIRANSTKTDDLIQEFIFDYIDTKDPPTIKMSILVYNLGHQWIPSPNRIRKVSIFLNLSFRITHSPSNGPAMTCVRGNGGGSMCNSSIAEVSSVLNLVSGLTVLRAFTPTVRMEYGYAIEGTIDGAKLFNNNASIAVERTVHPFGPARRLEAIRRAGFIIQSNASEAEQSFSAGILMQIPEFRNQFYFDPDVSITLLFDPRDNLPPEESDGAREASTSVALIVSLVVVAVVVIAAGTVFATVVYPYLKRNRDAPSAAEAVEDTELESNPQQNGWKRVEKPSK